jgi:ankyrin repeat protein
VSVSPKGGRPKAHSGTRAKRKGAESKGPRAAEVVRAAQAADLGQLERLHARGADWNASWRNYRPLHALIQEEPHAERAEKAGTTVDAKRLACLDWLLAHGADPEALGAWPSLRAILVAAFAGVPEYVERLRAAGAHVDLHVEAALGDVAVVRKRLGRGKEARERARSLDRGGATALACCAGSRLFRDDARGEERLREVATLLLDAGADPDAKVRSWAHDVDVAYFAIGAKHLEMLELLLARGANAGAALVSAAWHEDRRFAEAALRHGAEPDRSHEGDRPILNELVRWGQVDSALWLLAHGAGPNAPDARGWTALHQAVSRGNARMVGTFLEAGADPRRKDAEGITPFEMAVAKGNAKLVALFRKNAQA